MAFSLALSFDDVLLVPQKSDVGSRNEVDLATQIADGFHLKIPIISINMDTVTAVEMAVAMSECGGIGFYPRFDHPNVQAKKIGEVKQKGQRVFAALGLRDDVMERANLCVGAGASGLTIDVAHGHMLRCLEMTKELKRRFPNLPLISGVVATYEAAKDLFSSGADGVRVGLGAGTICVTRVVTGFGVPQITAISEAVRARNNFKNKFVLADGGMKSSGDIVKALAIGADAVILGSLLAGTDEAPGKMVKKNGIVYKEYNGSTSVTEKKRQMQKHDGQGDNFSLHIEGVEGLVRYKGPVAGVLAGLCAGIRSGFSYCGARNIGELHKRAKFIQITSAGMRESGAHDVDVV